MIADAPAPSMLTGPVLARERRWYHLRQADVARHACVTRQRVAQLEADETPTIPAVRRYVAALRAAVVEQA